MLLHFLLQHFVVLWPLCRQNRDHLAREALLYRLPDAFFRRLQNPLDARVCTLLLAEREGQVEGLGAVADRVRAHKGRRGAHGVPYNLERLAAR